MLDRTLAAALLIPGLPALGILAVVVRLSSPGPALYRQRRVGKGGKVFTMLKLRTLADATAGTAWVPVKEPRITTPGRWLRKTHLENLPQLWNVLCGDMSLVGPRPDRPELDSVLGDLIPGYPDRLAVQPGMMGLAQINLPADTDLESVRQRLALDLQYNRTASFRLDLRIVICSALRLIRFTPTVQEPSS